jgi:hypothetical protein
MSRIRGHLTYANVMVTILAFLVLGGGSAVALSGSNTVFSDDIVNNQVKSADVRNDTLTGVDLKESSLGRIPEAGNADKLDGQDSTHFEVGIMGGLMKDVGNTAVAAGIEWAPIGVSTQAATGSFVAPPGGFVARDLEISLASPNGSGETHTFVFSTAGSDLSCTVPENASSCSDTTHAVTVSAGQSYSILEDAVTGTSRTVDVRFGWRAIAP